MSGFTVDTKKLFEVVGMFDEICKDCNQVKQVLAQSAWRIHNIVGNGSPYEQSFRGLEQEIEKLERCQRNLRSAQRTLGDISNRYDALSRTFEPDFKSLLFDNLNSFGAIGGGFTDLLDLIINGGDLESIVGLADTLYQTIGGLLEQRAKDAPDYLEVLRGDFGVPEQSLRKRLQEELKEYSIRKAEKASEKIKVGTKWGRSGIYRNLQCYWRIMRSLETIHSKRFLGRDIVGNGSGCNRRICCIVNCRWVIDSGRELVHQELQFEAVTVGVIWATDVVCGYVQKAKGKESKRISETASDAFLDFIKQ